jgi:hypothetical protein
MSIKFFIMPSDEPPEDDFDLEEEELCYDND